MLKPLAAALLALPLLATAATAQQRPAPRPQGQPQGQPQGRPGQQQPSLLETTHQAIGACIGNNSQDMARIRQCIEAQRGQMEPQLAQAAQQVRATMPPARQQEFDRVQAAWGTYRDAQCGFVGSDPSAGQMAAVAQSDCQLEMLVERLELLRHVAEGAGQQGATPQGAAPQQPQQPPARPGAPAAGAPRK